MSDFNFDKSLVDLDFNYELAKDLANGIVTLDPANTEKIIQLHNTIKCIRDLAASALQAARALGEIAAAAAVLKPHPDYDFVDGDKIFLDNGDGTGDYFLLHYERETADWNLIPYTDKTFTEVKADEEGKVIAEPLIAFGYDVLQRVEDFELDELP